MFREFEIAYNWDEEYYDELQNKIGGCVRAVWFVCVTGLIECSVWWTLYIDRSLSTPPSPIIQPTLI